jgi:hypothetical protein
LSRINQLVFATSLFRVVPRRKVLRNIFVRPGRLCRIYPIPTSLKGFRSWRGRMGCFLCFR